MWPAGGEEAALPPRSYSHIVEAGYECGRDFCVGVVNLENVARCLLVAPHGGAIEPCTTEIMRAAARLGPWAYYHFDGRLRRGNWEQLHIASTLFDEPTLLEMLPQTRIVLSFHGEGGGKSRVIYVGGLYGQGRKVLLAHLNADLAHLGIKAVDALTSKRAEEVAGRSLRNITNRGRLGVGIQLEFSLGTRRGFFARLTRRGRKQPRDALNFLSRSIHEALVELTTLG